MNNSVILTQAEHLTLKANLSMCKQELISVERSGYEVSFTMDTNHPLILVVIRKGGVQVRLRIQPHYVEEMDYSRLNKLLINSWNRYTRIE